MNSLDCVECGGKMGQHNLSCSVWGGKKLENRIYDIMRNIMDIEPLDNATILAEECAATMDHDEWLDDPDHVVWEVALEFFNN